VAGVVAALSVVSDLARGHPPGEALEFLAALGGPAGMALYGFSKAALTLLTKAWSGP
jgi:hypothetical protein